MKEKPRGFLPGSRITRRKRPAFAMRHYVSYARSEGAGIWAAAPSSTSTWTRKGGGGANGTGPDRLRQRALPDFQSPLLLEQEARALAVATTQPRAKMAWQVNIRNAPTPTPWGNPGTPDTISYDDRHESQHQSRQFEGNWRAPPNKQKGGKDSRKRVHSENASARRQPRERHHPNTIQQIQNSNSGYDNKPSVSNRRGLRKKKKNKRSHLQRKLDATF
ncbi:hypothetical protein HPB47_026335 [Ixodes persulcatus]|uniref:Uncharacterized protein n=1 Tax=Ixodes persulcatus TaxID=34615 RepID=A0AC60PZM7_IXOPE|nr:hypothetical protein HPB47_026335 [Ixodes persulcatus]